MRWLSRIPNLVPARGQPAAAPRRLALVTLFPFAENLSDRQVAAASTGSTLDPCACGRPGSQPSGIGDRDDAPRPGGSSAVARDWRRAEEGRRLAQKEERQELAAVIGVDGTALPTTAHASDKIEGIIPRGVGRSGLRRSRELGLAKTHLEHVFTAAAVDFARVADWLADVPRARTRRSTFATLMALACE